MTQAVFIGALEWELRHRGLGFTFPELRDFTRDVWPLVEEIPPVGCWADAFLQKCQAEHPREREAPFLR
jgi:hypothetical protein